MRTTTDLAFKEHKLKKKQTQESVTDHNMLHFAYFFASPLVLEINKNHFVEDKLDEISFKEEFD